MKKFLFSIVAIACSLIVRAQNPHIADNYILQTTTINPAANHVPLYTVWKYNNQQVGSIGYGSDNGGLYMSNSIGDMFLSTTTSTNSIRFNTNNSQAMRISPEGRVSIGRNDARFTLDVEGATGVKSSLWVKTNSTNSSEIILEKQNQSYYSIVANNAGFLFYNHGTGNSFLQADANDNIGLGTADTKGHKLAVSGSIIATRVKVQQTPWPDYVFEPDYQLPSLAALETYVKTHKHLPGVPTAKEVTENGLDVGSTQAALLEKIEELTLIIIEQHKKLEAQEKRLKAVEKKLDK